MPMTLEQVLLKAYTDTQFRQRIQNGTEVLASLSEQERTAVKSMDFGVLNVHANADEDGTDSRLICIGRC